jgi:hypothetical protein
VKGPCGLLPRVVEVLPQAVTSRCAFSSVPSWPLTLKIDAAGAGAGAAEAMMLVVAAWSS